MAKNAAEKALLLVASNVSRLTEKGHSILNAGIAECLALGWVKFAPKKRVGYIMTPLGKAALKEK